MGAMTSFFKSAKTWEVACFALWFCINFQNQEWVENYLVNMFMSICHIAVQFILASLKCRMWGNNTTTLQGVQSYIWVLFCKCSVILQVSDNGRQDHTSWVGIFSRHCVCWWIQFMRFLTVQFSLASYYVLPHRYKYLNVVFLNAYSFFFPLCKISGYLYCLYLMTLSITQDMGGSSCGLL